MTRTAGLVAFNLAQVATKTTPTVLWRDVPRSLTQAEAAIYVELVEADGPLTVSQLVKAANGSDVNARSLAKTHVCNIRRKLGAHHIATVPGVGYRWVP